MRDFYSLKGTDGYEPVKLLRKIPFDKVSVKAIEELDRELEEEDQE